MSDDLVQIPITWATYDTGDAGVVEDYTGYSTVAGWYDGDYHNFSGAPGLLPSDAAIITKNNGYGVVKRIVIWDQSTGQSGNVYLRANGVPKLEIWSSKDNKNWTWRCAIESHPCDWSSSCGSYYSYDLGGSNSPYTEYADLPDDYDTIDGIYASGGFYPGPGSNTGSAMQFYKASRYLQGVKVYDGGVSALSLGLVYSRSGYDYITDVQVWRSSNGRAWSLAYNTFTDPAIGETLKRTYDPDTGKYFYYLDLTRSFPHGMPCRWFKVRYSTTDSSIKLSDGNTKVSYANSEIIPIINQDEEYTPKNITAYAPYLARTYYTAGGYYKTVIDLPKGIQAPYIKVRFHSRTTDSSHTYYLYNETGSYTYWKPTEIELWGDFEIDDFPILPFEAEWDDQVKIRRSWQTAINTAVAGPEVRSQLRQRVRLGASYALRLLDESYMRWLRRYLTHYYAKVWGFPVWPGRVELTAEAAAETFLLTVSDTTDKYFSDVDYAALINPEDQTIWEVHRINTYALNEIELLADLEKTWAAGTWVLPVFRAYLPQFNIKDWARPYGGLAVDVDETKCRLLYI